jgi:hypothetical protein
MRMMVRACSTHGTYAYKMALKNMKGRDKSEDLGIDGRAL